MEPAARRYSCAQCQTPVLVCSHCDHGNRYCQDCAREVRQCKQRGAAKRYQNSLRGRSNHARRQRRYRERQRRKSKTLAEIVTHQGSPPVSLPALLSPEAAVIEVDAPQPLWQCHFCQGNCAEMVRVDFLRRRIRRLARLTHQKVPHHARDP